MAASAHAPTYNIDYRPQISHAYHRTAPTGKDGDRPRGNMYALVDRDC